MNVIIFLLLAILMMMTIPQKDRGLALIVGIITIFAIAVVLWVTPFLLAGVYLAWTHRDFTEQVLAVLGGVFTTGLIGFVVFYELATRRVGRDESVTVYESFAISR